MCFYKKILNESGDHFKVCQIILISFSSYLVSSTHPMQ